MIQILTTNANNDWDLYRFLPENWFFFLQNSTLHILNLSRLSSLRHHSSTVGANDLTNVYTHDVVHFKELSIDFILMEAFNFINLHI